MLNEIQTNTVKCNTSQKRITHLIMITNEIHKFQKLEFFMLLIYN